MLVGHLYVFFGKMSSEVLCFKNWSLFKNWVVWGFFVVVVVVDLYVFFVYFRY